MRDFDMSFDLVMCEPEIENSQPRSRVREHEVRRESGQVLRTQREPEGARSALTSEPPDPPAGEERTRKVQSSVRTECEEIDRIRLKRKDESFSTRPAASRYCGRRLTGVVLPR